ncbi:serine hydrolase domain-containing protein [Biformimicrobium ophioploci]|uniref:Beta-lactamase-related domain-containing protein n=1 Tax=Biformimicrobium ophioploci TaxID=3036711 RepID=A0ABQ6LXK1_9GAMM|nr:serine hydrolase domain-containing protein [Microbulbifer sp. NKW57]GMG86846.1 hypothetical protein MNKW57_11670 [Microbulbifer sp. NKW57]
MSRHYSRPFLTMLTTACATALLTICSPVLALDLDKALRDVASKNRLVGMSAVVVADGSADSVFHYGFSDLDQQRPVNDRTMYRIASISKMATAVAVMKLYEAGKIDLDRDVSDYLGFSLRHPEFAGVPITAKMLLSHTSGLRDGKGYFDFSSGALTPESPFGIRTLLQESGKYFTADMWGSEQPGPFFTYANVNSGVLGTLVEKVSGQRFDLFVKQEILEPLGMDGGFNVYEIEGIENLAVLYRASEPQADRFAGGHPARDFSAYRPGHNGLLFGPQGSLRTSAVSLVRFMKMLMNGGEYDGVRILKPETVALMDGAVWTFNGKNGDSYHNLFHEWGLGPHRITGQKGGDRIFGNLPMVGHAGEAYGLISDMYFNREKGVGVVFITNGLLDSGTFEYGEDSAFYAPEEETFKVVEKYLNLSSRTPRK